ncbi:hypothetical protein EJ02DRAFT_469333 [Clathrospora elynae]|uniref:BRCT domain-containing protein n=1 Tax=Clathrospora elynae TaxID=706981 RepID=A0A6A5SKQ3_9PLEO|nr:hypothetical protein EJ02DRAFT_469333 [Clathrospora elynae]
MDATDAGYGTGQLPLAGAVLCCTSIAPEQRANLAAIGAQMGATIKLDLTSDVTHLIVGSTDSAKYRYVAKSRDDVKVLSPAWLEALREVWLEGHDNVDVAALEKEHRMPTLCGLKICLTGFDNPEERKSIQETVDNNGAEYHGDLTKSVTHLIAATPSGKKYEHALNWRMKIVSLQWLEQSLERGMVLDEALYNPTMPVEERGQGAWERTQSTPPALGKRIRDVEPSQALNPFRRKLRRSASTRMGSQSEALWAGITAAGLERQQDDGDDWTEDTVAKQDSTRVPTPVSSLGDAATHQDEAPADGDPADARHASLLLPHHGIFQGRIVCPHGFNQEKTDILRRHLDSNGARVLSAGDLNNFSSDDLSRGYLLIPHDTEVDLTVLPERAGPLITLVTNWWVERCLHGNRLVDPADDILSRPFERFIISGFSGITVNSTGFAGVELLHVTKVVALMGAIYDERLSVKTSVMICNSPSVSTPKLKFATDKRIPAVHVTWLWECLRSGRLQPYGEYQLNMPAQQPQPQLQKAKRPQASNDALSEEGNGKLPQKMQQTAIMITKPPRAQRPQRPGVLDFAPSTDAAPAPTTESLTRPNIGTNHSAFDHDEPAIGGFDGAASLPLQDITASSPRRRSTSPNTSRPNSRPRSSSAESLIKAAPAPRKSKLGRTPTPDSAVPAPAPDSAIPTDTEPPLPPPEAEPKESEQEKDYSDILAQLRANRKVAPTSADQGDEKKRKRRQLGRVASTRSNQSAGDGSGNVLAEDENTVLVDDYQPSQELGWDSPGAAKAREQMIKKLGGTVKEKSVAVQGIGVVKDVGGEPVGRAGRKRRG